MTLVSVEERSASIYQYATKAGMKAQKPLKEPSDCEAVLLGVFKIGLPS
jgi:hypothetical protein